MERDSFIFYRSFYEAVRDIPSKDIKLEVLSVVIEYALYGRLPEDLKPFASGMFTLIKPVIDKNNQQRENGRRGGRTKKSKPQKYNLTFAQEIELIKADTEFSAQFQTEFSLSPSQFEASLQRFLSYLTHYKSGKPHDSIDDARSHLRYWMNKTKNQTPDLPADYSFSGGFGGQDL